MADNRFDEEKYLAYARDACDRQELLEDALGMDHSGSTEMRAALEELLKESGAAQESDAQEG